MQPRRCSPGVALSAMPVRPHNFTSNCHLINRKGFTSEVQASHQVTATRGTVERILRGCTSTSRLLVVRLSEGPGCTCAHCRNPVINLAHSHKPYSDSVGYRQFSHTHSFEKPEDKIMTARMTGQLERTQSVSGATRSELWCRCCASMATLCRRAQAPCGERPRGYAGPGIGQLLLHTALASRLSPRVELLHQISQDEATPHVPDAKSRSCR